MNISHSHLFSDVKGWNDGTGWYDTRVLSVHFDANTNDMTNGNRKSISMTGIWITAQRKEVVRGIIWPGDIESSPVILELLHVAFSFKVEGGLSPKFTLLIYYEPDSKHWTRGYTAKYLKGERVDISLIAPVLCHRLPKASINTTTKKAVDFSRIRNLSDSILDKNWTPFTYQDRLLWSYSISPHIVCENDVDLRRRDTDVQCAFCQRKYDSFDFKMWEAFSTQLLSRYNTSKGAGAHVQYHLNGVPAFHIAQEDFYLGIAHATIKYDRSTAPMNH